MSTLGDSFPRLMASGPADPSALADLPFGYGDGGTAAVLANVLLGQQSLAARSAGTRALHEVTLAFYDDLAEGLDEAGEMEAAERREWAFFASIVPMGTGVARRQLQLTRAWALRSVLDRYEDGSAYHLDADRLIRTIGQLNEWLSLQVLISRLEWARHLYWYSWATNDLVDLADTYFGGLVGVAVDVVATNRFGRDIQDEGVQALLQLAQWAHRHQEDAAQELAEALGGILGHGDATREQRKAAGMLVASNFGRRLGGAPSRLAQQLLDDYADLLEGHERFQLLSVAAAGDTDLVIARFDEFLEGAAEHARAVSGAAPSVVDAQYGQGRMFKLVLPVLRTLLRAGARDRAHELLGVWLDRRVRNDLVWLMPSEPSGASWFWPSGATAPATGAETFALLVDALNLALDLAVTNVDGRPGLPLGTTGQRHVRASEGALLEDALERHLRLHAVDGAAWTSDGALFVAPWLPLAVQALALRAGGRALPLSVSLAPPGYDRRPDHAAVWIADVASGRTEARAVESLLGESGIAVDVFDGAPPAAFADVYRDPDYDVVWLAAHAGHDGVWPEESRIILSDEPGGQLSLRELADLEVPESGGRRLLVLNACDTGAAAVLGGPGGFGLAGMLAGPRQAVVAHLWPVHDLSASVFGVLLAERLRREDDFFAAFAACLRARAQGTPVDDLLTACGPPGEELRDLVVREPADLNSFVRWASPAFFE